MKRNEFEFRNKNDLEIFIKNLPEFLTDYFLVHSKNEKVIEILFDLGRQPQIRLVDDRVKYISQKLVSWQDIDFIVKRINAFSYENRASFNHTLHRISCIRNRQFLITGLTCRIGRVIFGSSSLIKDLLKSNKSILILGRPGTGKTTVIREIARVLSNELFKRVIIIDTSDEIASDNEIPHLGVGKARLLAVPKMKLQHEIILEAVENHMPEIIVIDEIGTKSEALAIKIIAEKGVNLISTVHGSCLSSLINNPDLSPLIGGIEYVILSDEIAKQRRRRKSFLERKSSSSFNILIELTQKNEWIIHENLNQSIDRVLNQIFIYNQLRKHIFNEQIEISWKLDVYNQKDNQIFNLLLKPPYNFLKFNSYNNSITKLSKQKLIIFSYALSNNIIIEMIMKSKYNIKISRLLQNATLIFVLQNNILNNSRLLKLAKIFQIPIFTFTSSNLYDLINLTKLIIK